MSACAGKCSHTMFSFEIQSRDGVRDFRFAVDAFGAFIFVIIIDEICC